MRKNKLFLFSIKLRSDEKRLIRWNNFVKFQKLIENNLFKKSTYFKLLAFVIKFPKLFKTYNKDLYYYL